MKSSRIPVIIFFVSIYSISAYSRGQHFIKPSDSAVTNKTPPTTYTIVLSVRHDGTLALNDPSGKKVDTISVFYDDEIVWTSDPSIKILKIKEKHTTEHFTDKPAATNKWRGKVKNWPDRSYHEALYSIKWKDGNGKHTYDPLIKINPSHPIE